MICNNNYLADILGVCEIKDLIWVMHFQSPKVYYILLNEIVIITIKIIKQLLIISIPTLHKAWISLNIDNRTHARF